MQVSLDPEIIKRLSSKGILAYLAVSLAWNSEPTTATLAGLVKCTSAVMLEGLKELSSVCPEMVNRHGTKWICGTVQAGDGKLQNSESGSSRRVEFIDDLKKYWDYLNPTIPFSMNGKEGVAISRFLADHPAWTQETWRIALKHRIVSVRVHGYASTTEPIWVWVPKLDLLLGGILNRYGKPVEGETSKTTEIRNRNRAAVERAVANA